MNLTASNMAAAMIRVSVSLLFVMVFSDLAPSADPVKSQQKPLAIITSFSPQFYAPFIKKFQELRPDIKVQVLNKKTTAAIDEILRGNERRFDLFWSSSPDAFVVLKQAERLRYLDYIAHYPPISPTQPYFDEQGWFYNFALSGVGFMWNRATLAEGGIEPPVSWRDLTHPRFYGQMAMSTPSRSGTNHLIVESILQDMGWEKGWAYLMAIAGNMKTITARSFSVPDGVAGGRFGAGLMIDFLAYAKIHLDPVNQFEYGDPTYVMPARIAALQGGRDVETTVAFIDFLLSADGQKVLLQPEINRLPVSREPLAGDEETALPLISLIQQEKTRTYDTGLSTVRYSLVNVLFDELITYRLLERKRLWKKLIDLDKSNHTDPQGIKILKQRVIDEVSQMPVTADQSLDPALNELFTSASLSAEQREQRRKLLDDWEYFVTRQLQTADKLILELVNDTDPGDGEQRQAIQ